MRVVTTVTPVTHPGITVILTMTAMSRDNGHELPQVPYATALELYVQMCFTFLIASMVEFVGVHYFTKHGGGDYHNIGTNSHCVGKPD